MTDLYIVRACVQMPYIEMHTDLDICHTSISDILINTIGQLHESQIVAGL